MTDVNLDEEIRNSKVIVWSGRYAYLKLEAVPEHCRFFMIAQDNDEITAIVEEKNLALAPHLESVTWFKAFEFRCATPFLAKGFLAKISSTIASKSLNILFVSTFSKDYAFIREEDYLAAIKALQDIDFTVTEVK